MRPRRAVRLDLHLIGDNLARQRSHGLDCPRARSRQAQIERVDSQRLHQMQDFNFFRNGGIAYRGRLQPIAQALIIEQHGPRRQQARRIILVPVVDEVGSVHEPAVSNELRAMSTSTPGDAN